MLLGRSISIAVCFAIAFPVTWSIAIPIAVAIPIATASSPIRPLPWYAE